ncbi:helix-turn-helix transcriptional regulator [Bacillus atrophaeus]|uniref:helix-turn-helix transcriptional regulator n=1 Tax=Bacillus atrophaeus TaxID=1452 RepID=UPI00255B59B3|nr:helix-turn-helix transcriptional regulator [Bacillus atrophaeus]MDL5141104.1 helix-turn-helix transcriptional regulator [Bacillus atrophaeus]
MYLNKFPDFDGDLKDYIRVMRAYKNMSSTKLSKMIGKNRAYISQIENGHNKNPEYETLYKIFKILGVKEENIESYLYHFNVLSPEHLKHEEEMFIAKMENQDEDYYVAMAELEEERNEDFISEARPSYNSNDLMEDMSKAYIGEINEVLKVIFDEPSGMGFEIVKGLNRLTGDMTKNKQLYSFTSKILDKDLSLLDEPGMIKVLNVLIEELNRREQETIAFGKPKVIEPVKSLN